MSFNGPSKKNEFYSSRESISRDEKMVCAPNPGTTRPKRQPPLQVVVVQYFYSKP